MVRKEQNNNQSVGYTIVDHHLLLRRWLLLLWRELVRALGLEELALFDAVLESAAHGVLRELDFWVCGLDVLRAGWVGRVRNNFETR